MAIICRTSHIQLKLYYFTSLELSSFTNETYKYTYDQNGNITIIKKDGIIYEEFWYDELNQLTEYLKAGTDYEYTYDNGGNLLEVKKNGAVEKSYKYEDTGWKDKLTSYKGQKITYDAWGNLTSIGGSDAAGIGEKNPIRYRGYYFDKETRFYYLGARYYDPETGRFISADVPVTLTFGYENMAQYNLYAYCFNNPVNMYDPTGTWQNWLQLS